MQSANNVIQMEAFKRSNEQELIDEVGAQAFVQLRDSAEKLNLPMNQVIAEHLLGLSLVMASVEGCEKTRQLLASISSQLESV